MYIVTQFNKTGNPREEPGIKPKKFSQYTAGPLKCQINRPNQALRGLAFQKKKIVITGFIKS